MTSSAISTSLEATLSEYCMKKRRRLQGERSPRRTARSLAGERRLEMRWPRVNEAEVVAAVVWEIVVASGATVNRPSFDK